MEVSEKIRPELVKPIFVVGCERSGTTLLTSLLDNHPEIASTPETHFFSEIWPLYFFGHKISREQVNQAFSHQRMKDFLTLGRISKDEFWELFKHTPQSPRDFFIVLSILYLKKRGKKRVCEKTPSHLNYVERIIEWFPDAKIIYIVRDGRDVVCSLEKAPWTIKNLLENSHKWLRTTNKGLKLEKVLEPDQFLSVKYENLILSPFPTLTTILHFLEVDEKEPRYLLERKTNESYVFPEWERAWKKDVFASFDTSRLGRWRTFFSEEDQNILNLILSRRLNQLGYPVHRHRITVLTLFRFLSLLNALFWIKIKKNIRIGIKRIWLLWRHVAAS